MPHISLIGQIGSASRSRLEHPARAASTLTPLRSVPDCGMGCRRQQTPGCSPCLQTLNSYRGKSIPQSQEGSPNQSSEAPKGAGGAKTLGLARAIPAGFRPASLRHRRVTIAPKKQTITMAWRAMTPTDERARGAIFLHSRHACGRPRQGVGRLSEKNEYARPHDQRLAAIGHQVGSLVRRSSQLSRGFARNDEEPAT